MSDPSTIPARQKRLTRRRFFTSCAGVLAAGTGTYAYSSLIAPHDLSIEKIALRIPNLPVYRHNTRLALISDLHAGPHVSLDYLHRAINTAADLQPDFLLIPGDFVDSTLSHLDPLCKILAPVAARIRTYGSTGNHDFAHDFRTLKFAGAVCAALESAGVHMLRNDFDQPSPKTPNDLCFVGLEDLWSGRLDASTLADVPQEATTILLSHNPDTYENVADYRFHLMLSGHTHGGQVCIPGIGPLILPVQHRERTAGLFHFSPNDPTHPPRSLYVSRGIGHLMKVRFFCPPEITVITLQCA